ncbi:MAG: hypothetical protein GXX84_05620 [Acidobacteria bacterium]|nr:hypothetical protein [Acidobacteriota bacterium]
MGRHSSLKAEQWRQHVESYRSSGLTRKAYCERNQIKESAFGYWYTKMKRGEKSQDDLTRPRLVGVGPFYVSEIIYTCERCGANAVDYLTELQKHSVELSENPGTTDATSR